MNRRRIPRILGLAFLLLIATPMTWVLFEHLLGTWQLRSSLRELRARGEHVDFDRLLPPLSPSLSNSMDRLIASAERLESSGYLLPPSLRLSSPGRGIPVPRLGSWVGARGTSVTWPMVGEWIHTHNFELQKLQAALAEPLCRPYPNHSTGVAAPLPHLARLKSAATTLSLLTAHHAREGQFDSALAALRSLSAIDARSSMSFDTSDLGTFLAPSSSRTAMRTVHARIAIPPLAKAVVKGFATDVHRELLATDIALQRYHRRHGHYPQSLERLVPDFLLAVPIDSMDGHPLRYRLEPGGAFTLWSSGDDRRDDGGDPTPKDRDVSYWWRAKDGVWPRPASESEIGAWMESETLKRADRTSNASGPSPNLLSPK